LRLRPENQEKDEIKCEDLMKEKKKLTVVYLVTFFTGLLLWASRFTGLPFLVSKIKL